MKLRTITCAEFQSKIGEIRHQLRAAEMRLRRMERQKHGSAEMKRYEAWLRYWLRSRFYLENVAGCPGVRDPTAMLAEVRAALRGEKPPRKP